MRVYKCMYMYTYYNINNVSVYYRCVRDARTSEPEKFLHIRVPSQFIPVAASRRTVTEHGGRSTRETG